MMSTLKEAILVARTSKFAGIVGVATVAIAAAALYARASRDAPPSQAVADAAASAPAPPPAPPPAPAPDAGQQTEEEEEPGRDGTPPSLSFSQDFDHMDDAASGCASDGAAVVVAS